MRKLLALLTILCLMMMPLTAFAAPYYLETAGVTMEVPDGMTAEDATDETAYALQMTVDGRDDLVYMYVLNWIEEYEGLWIEDLTDEQGQALLDSYAQALDNPSFDAAESGDIKYLIAVNEDGTQLHYVTLLNGWVCDVCVVSAQVLTDDEIELCAILLDSITFDE